MLGRQYAQRDVLIFWQCSKDLKIIVQAYAQELTICLTGVSWDIEEALRAESCASQGGRNSVDFAPVAAPILRELQILKLPRKFL